MGRYKNKVNIILDKKKSFEFSTIELNKIKTIVVTTKIFKKLNNTIILRISGLIIEYFKVFPVKLRDALL